VLDGWKKVSRGGINIGVILAGFPNRGS